MRAVAVVEECGQVPVGTHEHAAAETAIAAVGTTFGDELFSTERGCACSTGSAEDVDDGAINEHQKNRGVGVWERWTLPVERDHDLPPSGPTCPRTHTPERSQIPLTHIRPQLPDP